MRKMIILAVFGMLAAVSYAQPAMAQTGFVYQGESVARAWGNNSDGQLGNGTYGYGAYSTTPVQVKNLSGVKAIAAGSYHSLAKVLNPPVAQQ